MPSVLIPAHDEERAIGRTLHALLDGAEPGEFEVIIVCNGCTDRARAVGADVRVLEIPNPSKRQALFKGDAVVGRFPKIYLDADVELGTESMRALCSERRRPGIMAAGSQQLIELDRASELVRGYYAVWT
jgi:cellulose synthase/poly-beta-1,6-N-acetylglucosamine synthase-like glycosyltransferase